MTVALDVADELLLLSRGIRTPLSVLASSPRLEPQATTVGSMSSTHNYNLVE